MAESLVLNEEQKTLFDELSHIVEDIQNDNDFNSVDYSAQEMKYRLMAQKAHDLHMSLKATGNEPKHHAYMYINREVPVENVEFYNHIHPVEDLLAFINDPDANNDPEDTTLGTDFKVKIYTNRWGHYDLYKFKRVENGWIITGASTFQNNNADKSGMPALFDALKHDNVCYPAQIGEVLEIIWDKGKNGATEEDLQRCLSDFGEWISICEKSRPEASWGL